MDFLQPFFVFPCSQIKLETHIETANPIQTRNSSQNGSEPANQIEPNHWHKWKLLYFERWNFLVWKRYWPLYSTEYIYWQSDTSQSSKERLRPTFVIMIICYSSLILLKKSAQHLGIKAFDGTASLSMCTGTHWPYLEKMMVGTLEESPVYFVSLSSTTNAYMLVTHSRQKNG